MQVSNKSLYTVSAEFNVGIIGHIKCYFGLFDPLIQLHLMNMQPD